MDAIALQGVWPSFPKAKVPEPTPAPVAAGRTGGIGGGRTLNLEEIPASVWSRQPSPERVRAMAEHLRKNHEIMERIRPIDPLAVPPRTSKEFDLRQTIAKLRGEIHSLKKDVKTANERPLLSWTLWEEAQDQIAQLGALLESTTQRMKGIEEELRRQRVAYDEGESHETIAGTDPEAGIEYPFDTSQPLLPPFEEIWAQFLALPNPKLTPSPSSFPWLELGAAVATFLAMTFVVPSSWTLVRTVGYSVSAGLAVKSLKSAGE